MVRLSDPTHNSLTLTYRCPQPRDESRFGLHPLSLAATYGIEVSLYSYSYLDVSVHCVRLTTLYIQVAILVSQWVSPFRNPKIKA